MKLHSYLPFAEGFLPPKWAVYPTKWRNFLCGYIGDTKIRKNISICTPPPQFQNAMGTLVKLTRLKLSCAAPSCLNAMYCPVPCFLWQYLSRTVTYIYIYTQMGQILWDFLSQSEIWHVWANVTRVTVIFFLKFKPNNIYWGFSSYFLATWFFLLV